MMRSALVPVPSITRSRDLVFLGPKVLGLAFEFLDDEGEGLREELSMRMEVAESRSSESFEAVNRRLESFSAQALSQLAVLSARVTDMSTP